MLIQIPVKHMKQETQMREEKKKEEEEEESVHWPIMLIQE
jgi:hypothetical protein